MNKKIYNMKSFCSGVFFLLLAVGYNIFLISDSKSINLLMNVKSILFTIICIFIGVGQVFRSLVRKYSREDEQNNDERNKLVILKTESSVYKITFNFSIILVILLVIAIGIVKSNKSIDPSIFNTLLGMFIGVSIIPTIMLTAYIGANIYHNKRN